MKRLFSLALGMSLLMTVSPVWGSPTPIPVRTDAPRYSEDQVVQITLGNVQGAESIDIHLVENDQIVAQYYLSEEQQDDRQVVWDWDQRHACYGACQNVWEGDPAQPGIYEVRASTLAPDEFTRFSIGAYFHVGFEARPNADFVVFTNKPEMVEQMRAELERPQEERQIVAGTVKARRPGYNPEWRYILGPRSIFLGEVFIEVCDGSPYYVQRHLDEWRGKTWCPWSSHVASEGL